jgi:S-adenosylmethionine synthetase
MKRNIHVEELKAVPLSEMEVELVERKGKGHPDSVIDGCAEAVSRGLSQYYMEHYGRVLHHNVDKGLIVGGRSAPRFGGGEVLEPIYIIVAGRAFTYVPTKERIEPVPVGTITLNSIRGFLSETFRYLDPVKHVVVDYKIRQGSLDLISLFDRGGEVPVANDTSIGVGFAPFTGSERLVLEVERYLNSPRLKSALPEVGEDIKVMALRHGRKVSLTIAAAMISHLVHDASHYISVREEVESRVRDLAAKTTDLEVDVVVNAADDPSRGVYYLTVTGTSAESGDDGNTGRGNRPNGLITPMRQYSMEAVAGKNPINHTGKLFNIVAQRIADRVVEEVKGVREVYIRLLSKIGSRIDHPEVASAAVVLEPGWTLGRVEGEVDGIIDEELQHITDITPAILSGKVGVVI